MFFSIEVMELQRSPTHEEITVSRDEAMLRALRLPEPQATEAIRAVVANEVKTRFPVIYGTGWGEGNKMSSRPVGFGWGFQ